ncbi:MAG TPA: serine/threonine-protein kinase, partial [Kofleriaceae bacterium]|nr:serine/threonine-protein kinase [Kofleriaceae bacterium]
MLGKTIGNYIVRHKLGEGGMGSVYFAEHPAIGKRVALKVLHPDFSSDPEIVSRFFNEAKAVNDIQHPNIIDIVDFGTIPPPMPGEPPLVYFIMEYVEGATLTQLIQREAPLAPDRAVDIALQIADALAASHSKGVVHRDLKPDNVMLISRGRQRDFVKLLDFGIAKLSGAARTHRTRTGTVMGTPQYMSPEQCDGRGLIDHRADIYALGIVLYQMLTGRVPFGGEGHGEVMIHQMTKPPLAPSRIAPQIPEAVELIVLKALEKRAEDRFQRVDDMALALQNPTAYIAAHGGSARFLVSPVVREPGAAGATAAAAPTASSSRPVPTTLSGSASQAVSLPVAPPPVRKRFPIGFGIAVGVFVIAIAAGIIFQGSAPSTPAAQPKPTGASEPPAPATPAVAPSAPAPALSAPAPSVPAPSVPAPSVPAPSVPAP